MDTQPGHGHEETRLITRGRVGGRAITDRQTIHIHDLAAESDSEFPESKMLTRASRDSDYSCYAFVARRRIHRRNKHSSNRGPSVHG